jgi:hypothetical protein
MRLTILLCALIGCMPHFYNVEAFNAIQAYQQEGSVPSCRQFYEGQQLPDGSVVDQINGTVVTVIIPDPRSAEGEHDHSIPCRK